MTTFDDIRDAVRAVADARSDRAQLSLGTPGGDAVEINGEYKDVGAAWGENKPLQILLEGVASYIEATANPTRLEITGDIMVAETDYFLAVTSIPGGGLTITLPTPTGDGVAYVAKDENGNASGSDPITIQGQNGETIDGAPSVSLTGALSYVRVYAGDGSWHIW